MRRSEARGLVGNVVSPPVLVRWKVARAMSPKRRMPAEAGLCRQ
jgi:hypothetical protein